MQTLTTEDIDLRAIADSVSTLREQAVGMLGELVREPSLLGDEASAQLCMKEAFGQLGLRVDEFEIDEQKIRSHPGYSPSKRTRRRRACATN